MNTTTITDKNTSVEQSQKIIHELISKITDGLIYYLESALSFIGIEDLTWLNNIWIRSAIVFALIVVFIITIRKIVNFIINKITANSIINLNNKFIVMLKKPLYYSIVILSIIISINILNISDGVLTLIFRVLLSIFLLIWLVPTLKTNKIMLNYLAFSKNKHNFINPQTFPLFLNISLIIISVFYLYLLFATWGIDMGVLIASAGFFGLAIGFAAKDTLANLFSGVFIIADRPYKIGDFVVLDSGERGEITHIGIRSTRIMTRDDIEVTVPNSVMGNSKIINESGGPHPKSRIRIHAGVAYGSDIDKVRTLLLAIAEKNSFVCANPEPRVRFRKFANSSLDFELLCWIDEPVLRGRVMDLLNCDIYKEFMANNIEIPYQKQDLYIKSLPK